MTQREAWGRIRGLRPATALGLLLLYSASIASGYSVLTHEAIIDSTWDGALVFGLAKLRKASGRLALVNLNSLSFGAVPVDQIGNRLRVL
jgi:hypothetical protein